jgi:hypothetical protein
MGANPIYLLMHQFICVYFIKYFSQFPQEADRRRSEQTQLVSDLENLWKSKYETDVAAARAEAERTKREMEELSKQLQSSSALEVAQLKEEFQLK